MQGTRNWTSPDALAARAERNGLDILFVVNGCPAWACALTFTPPTDEPTLSGFRSFVADAVSRYGAHGSVWTAATHPRVMWQIGNEVNGGHFFGSAPTAAGYAAFLSTVSATVKSVDPTATVVAAGLVEKPAGPGGVGLDAFLRALYQQPGYTSSFDVAAVHAYAESPEGTVRVLDTARRVMLENGDASRPLWVTEMGWSTAGPLSVDEATQASYLRASWDTLLACRARWNLEKVMWFGYADVSPSTLSTQDAFGAANGLRHSDLSPKPAYDAFLEYLAPALPAGRAETCDLPGGATFDITAPDTAITSSPGVTDDVSDPAVGFAASEDGVRYECSLDGVESWRPCTSPDPVPSRREGAHFLRVRAIDANGNIDATPARADWMLDLTPPDTIRTSALRRGKVLTVGFTGADAVGVAGFECRLDERAWQRCTSPYRTRPLRAGRHIVDVRALDRAGNVDETASRSVLRIPRPKPRRRR